MATTERVQPSPEPWRHDPADGALIIAGPLDRPVAIAEVFYVGGAEGANARLMRAAPEMYRTIEHLLTLLGAMPDGGRPLPVFMLDAMDEAGALLAKIDGKEN